MATSEAQKAAIKKWQKANPEKTREAAKRWRDANPGKAQVSHFNSLSKLFATNPVKFAARQMLGNVRNRAKAKSLPFDLDLDWIMAGIRAKCPLTGRRFVVMGPAQPGTKNGGPIEPYSPSIDQKEPGQGYTKANCRVISSIANYAKNKFTDEQLIEFCRTVASHHSH